MCTLQKHGRVYLLTLTGDGDEHRLNPTLLDAICSALAQIRDNSADNGGTGTALVTAAEGKFFSNGLDLAWAGVSPTDRLPLMSSALQRTFAALLSLPMPTIAAVTGHAVAAGCGLALSHDYVLMRRDRGFFYMSELDRGLPISRYFMALMRSKIPNSRTLRDVLLRSAKITAAAAVEMGIIDRALGSAGETLEAALQLGEELAGMNWDGQVYMSKRRDAFHEVFDALRLRTSEPVVELMHHQHETHKAPKARL